MARFFGFKVENSTSRSANEIQFIKSIDVCLLRTYLIATVLNKFIMLYYIDTNGLYNIRKIDSNKIKSCFTSIMAILELVSGITEKTFKKRKAILNMVFSYGITIDYAFPEEIIYNSFDYFEEYDFIEQREDSIIQLVNTVIKSEDYLDYTQSIAYNSEMGHEYFKQIDENLAVNFRMSTNKGTKELKMLQKNNSPENIVTFNGINYDLNTSNGLEAAFPFLSISATIEAMATMIVNLSPLKQTPIEDIYSSYNGLTIIYVMIFSRYCESLLLNSNSPQKNDAIDLLHLLYLKSDYKRYIVSDDRIFKKFFPENTLPLSVVFNA